MGVLFISHSGKDNAVAIQIRDGLQGEGFDEIVLQADSSAAPSAGSPVRSWRQRLEDDPDRCAAVLVLLSAGWLASAANREDLRAAARLGKRLVTVLLTPTPQTAIPVELRVQPSWVDWTQARGAADRLSVLRQTLRQAGLQNAYFAWPPVGDPERSPYRGLSAFEEDDAAVFFGREREMTKALDRLRLQHATPKDHVFAIVARSGAGKSSFLRAGLLPRLKRDPRFAVLPVVEGDGDVLHGSTGVLAAFGWSNEPASDAELADRLAQLRTRMSTRGEGTAGAEKTVVLPVDPGRLLLGSESTSGEGARAVLHRIWSADSRLVLLTTVRDDELGILERFDRDPRQGVHEFRLPAMSLDGLRQVVEAPGKIHRPPVRFEPDPVSTLTSEDLRHPDALALLSFTLARLVRSADGDEPIALGEYCRGLGGLSGAINDAATSVYQAAVRDPACPTNRAALDVLMRKTLVPGLVYFAHAEAPLLRRRIQLDELTKPTRALLQHFANEGLVTFLSDSQAHRVEVTHEAVFRNWWGLAEWVRDERSTLEQVERLKRAAEEWDIDERSRDCLAHQGRRLEEAEALLAREDFAEALQGVPLEYLEACRAHEQHQNERQIRRKARRRFGGRVALATLLVAVVLAGGAMVEAYLTLRATEHATSATLVRESQAAVRSGHAERALRLAVVAAGNSALSPRAQEAPLQLGRAALAAREAVVLTGHGDALSTASFSPRRGHVLTASLDGTARLWMADGPRRWRYQVLKGHTGPVWAAVFNPVERPEGPEVVTVGADGSARVWSEAGGRWMSTTLAEGVAPVAAFLPAGDAIVIGSDADRSLSMWRRDERGDWAASLIAQIGVGLEGLIVAPGGRHIATLQRNDGAGLLSHDGSGWRLTRLTAHRRRVVNAAFSIDGTQLVTASADRTAQVWRIDSGAATQVTVLAGHDDVVTDAGFASDGRVVTGCADGTIRVWSPSIDGPWSFEVLTGHSSPVVSVEFAPDNRAVVSASTDGTARVWRAEASAGSSWRSSVLYGHDGELVSASFSPDGKMVLTASADGTARVWPIAQTSNGRDLAGHAGAIVDAAFAPDGAFLVTVGADKVARVWRPEGEPEALNGHRAALRAVTVSPTESRIASASIDGEVRVWGLAGPGKWQSEALQDDRQGVTTVAFSPDGHRLVTGSSGHSARIWQRNGGAWTFEVLRHRGPVIDVGFGTTYALTTENQGGVRVWRPTQDGWRADVLSNARVGAIHETDAIVTADADGTVRSWALDADRDWTSSIMGAHRDDVLAISFSADGQQVATASVDRTVRVWRRTAEGWSSSRLLGHEGPVAGAAFFAAGRGLVTWSSAPRDGAWVWRLNADDEWQGQRLPDTSKVRGVAVASDGERLVAYFNPEPGGGGGARIYDISGLERALAPWAPGQPDPAVALVAEVCSTLMSLEVTGAQAHLRPLAQLSEADFRAVPALAATGLRVGDDVCQQPLGGVDRLLTQTLPAKWWSYAR